MLKRKNFEDILIDIFVYTFLTILTLSALLPFANVFSKAVSEEWATVAGKVGIFPVGFQLHTLNSVISSKQFLNAFCISVILVVVGTLLSLLVTAVTAFPLSKRNLIGVKSVLVIYVFTMLFNGGLIPNYLLVKKLGLLNSLWALILPGMISVFNMLIIKNYFESLPQSLEESAKLDGASELTILFRIILPLSSPVLATIGLFYAVNYWNDFFGPMIYINKASLKPLQLYLRDVVLESNSASLGITKNVDEMMNISPEATTAATIVASTIPILLVYPFLQKYFVKGVLIGSVKG